jgi:hypothetical protein
MQGGTVVDWIYKRLLPSIFGVLVGGAVAYLVMGTNNTTFFGVMKHNWWIGVMAVLFTAIADLVVFMRKKNKK